MGDLSIQSHDELQTVEPATETLYAQFHAQIAAELNEKPGVLMINPPGVQEPYDFNIESAGSNPPMAEYEFLNVVPSMPGSEFFESYQSLVNTGLKLPPLDDDKQRDIEQINIDIATVKKVHQGKLDSAYNLCKKSPLINGTWQEFKETAEYKDMMETYNAEIKNGEDKIKSISSLDGFDVTHARNLIDPDVIKAYEMDVGSSESPTLKPEWTANPDPIDAHQQLSLHPGSIQVDINEKTAAYDFSDSNISADVQYGGFFGVNANGGWSEVKLDHKNSSFKFSLKIDGIVKVTVTPGDWFYSPVLVGLDKKDTFNDNWSARKENDTKYVYGSGGLLNSKMSHFYVFKSMTATIAMSKDDYSSTEKSFKGATGVQIGPFRFGGSASHHEHHVTSSEEDSVVSVNVESEVPIVLAKVMDKFGEE